MSTRRQFILLLGGAAAAWPADLQAQQPERMRRIGVFIDASERSKGYVATFSQRLEELGWKNDRNIRTEMRWWHETSKPVQATVGDLFSISPDVILTFTNLALATIKPIVGRIPIVFVGVADPVGSGFVASLSRPGGNVTGFASNEVTMGGKWLQILKETVPQLTNALVLIHSETPSHQAFWHSIEEAGRLLRIHVKAAGIHDAADIQGAISSFGAKDGGLVLLPHAIITEHRELTYALALRHRLPTVSATYQEGLVAYGADFRDSFRRAAEYVDRILRREKAGDLPVQQPTKFYLIVNLKTAKALGLEVSPILLARADEVIE